jgi:peptidoglycan/LPS O-acetylase OafA/YrhL
MVKQVVFSWADRHLIVNWREAYKLWSVQIELFFAAVSTLVTILTLVSDKAQEMFGSWRFAAAFALVSMIKFGLRMWRQEAGVRDGGDD